MAGTNLDFFGFSTGIKWFFLLIILTMGDPDLIDGIVHFLIKFGDGLGNLGG